MDPLALCPTFVFNPICPPMLAKDSGSGPTEGPGCVEAVRAGDRRGVKRS